MSDVPVEAVSAALDKHGPAGAALYVDAWARGAELPDDDRMGAVGEAWREDEWLEGLAAAESPRESFDEHEPRFAPNRLEAIRTEQRDARRQAEAADVELRRALRRSGGAAAFRARLDASIAAQRLVEPPRPRPWSQFDPPRQSKLAAKERAFEAKVAARAAVERRTGAPDDDPRVTRNPIRRGVLRVLDDLARVRVAFPSVRWLAARLMCSTRTVRRHLEDLNAWGYLSRHARFWRSGVQRSCLWVPRRPEAHEGHVGSAKARVDWLAARETLPRWLRLGTRPQKPSPNPPQDIARTGCVGGSGKLTLGVTPDRVCSVPNEPHRTLRVATEQRSREHAHRQTLNAHPISCAPS